jgi:hypothetical protein
MTFAERRREQHAAGPDVLLQSGNGALGSDFGGLIPNSIKYIIEFKQRGAGGVGSCRH